MWSSVTSICGPVLQQACSSFWCDGAQENSEIGVQALYRKTLEGHEDGLACLVFDRDGLKYATHAYEKRATTMAGNLKQAKAPMLPSLLNPLEKADPASRRVGWQRLALLHMEALGVPLEGRSQSWRGAGSPQLVYPTSEGRSEAAREKIIYRSGTVFPTSSESSMNFPWPEIVALLSEDEVKEPFWQVVVAFGVEIKESVYIVWVLLPLPVRVPQLLWATLTGKRQGNSSDVRRCHLIVTRVLDEVSAPFLADVSKNSWASASETARHVCSLLASAFEDEAVVGDTLVPRLGQVSVEKYQHLSSLYDEISVGWRTNDLGYGPISRHETNAEVAWVVADAEQLDSPLVYISHGFEDLTGYWRAFGLGRNARFVQPKDAQRNFMYNGPELSRMSEFCKQDTGQMLAFVLTERAVGRSIWILLFLKHIHRPDPENPSKKRHFIFGLHTDLYCQSEALNDILSLDQSESSVAALKGLRMSLQEKFSKFSFQNQSFHSLGDEVISEWLLSPVRESRSCFVDGTFAPRVGLAPLRRFRTRGVEEDILLKARTYLSNIIGVQPDQDMPLMISDTSAKDHPVVFVNAAWEAMTGYSKDHILARNSRFLQPAFGRLNQVVNGEELHRIKAFCDDPDQPRPHEESTLAFLLNEKANGDRFWNFLLLLHIRQGQHRFVVGCPNPLSILMPGVLMSRERSKWYDDEMGRTADEWGGFIARLRERIRAKEVHISGKDLLGPGGLPEVKRLAEIQIKEYMRTCEDFEGDHFVPKVGLKEVKQFKEGLGWQQVLQTMRSEVRRLTESPNWDGQDLSVCVADPNGADCPLVHVSRGFEELTGYHGEFALGRNCRFVQPKRGALNELFNGTELKRMKTFCRDAAAPLDARCIKTALPDNRMLTLLVNTHRERFPFWCVLWLERVEALGRPYIFSVHTHVNGGGRLVELLAGDEAGMDQLRRLRELFYKRQSSLAFESVKTVTRRCLEEWLASYPALLELPRAVCSGMPTSPFPLVGLEINAENTDMNMLVEAMENGIRHFHITFPTYGEVKDSLRHEFEARLMALRLAELLNRLRSHHLQYLRAGLCFSVRTQPHLVGAFSEIRKAVTSNGMTLTCWLLDARMSTPQLIEEKWAIMTHSRNIGEVKAIGLYGGGSQAARAVSSVPKGAPLSVYAGEMQPGAKMTKGDFELFQRVQAAGGCVMAVNIFGDNYSWLLSNRVQEQAAKLHVDPTIFLLKWVERRGYAALVPSLGVEPIQRNVVSSSSMGPERSNGSNSARKRGLSLQTSSASRSYVHKDWTPRTQQEFEGFHLKTTTLPPAQLAKQAGEANVHRGFVRAYRHSPSAEVCSLGLDADVELDRADTTRRRAVVLPNAEGPRSTADEMASAVAAQAARQRRASQQAAASARLSRPRGRPNERYITLADYGMGPEEDPHQVRLRAIMEEIQQEQQEHQWQLEQSRLSLGGTISKSDVGSDGRENSLDMVAETIGEEGPVAVEEDPGLPDLSEQQQQQQHQQQQQQQDQEEEQQEEKEKRDQSREQDPPWTCEGGEGEATLWKSGEEGEGGGGGEGDSEGDEIVAAAAAATECPEAGTVERTPEGEASLAIAEGTLGGKLTEAEQLEEEAPPRHRGKRRSSSGREKGGFSWIFQEFSYLDQERSCELPPLVVVSSDAADTTVHSARTARRSPRRPASPRSARPGSALPRLPNRGPAEKPNTRTAWKQLAKRAAAADAVRKSPEHRQKQRMLQQQMQLLERPNPHHEPEPMVEWSLLATPAAIPSRRSSELAGGGGGEEKRRYSHIISRA